ncbi:biotin transporter BioY [Campylobacter concisus]|uniref:biotin transporter BioY n=1 Tax=Campylobacter concisus TaxID=199 RepID=UPI00112F92A5|nr:biotin transporter BioY [Campylobacter concisus]
MDKSDPDVFYNKLREIKRQISFKISEIKSKKTEVFEELSHKNKIQSSEKVLEKNIRNIEKELCENKYFRYYLSGQKNKECIIDDFSFFLKETFSNCKFIDTKQGIILTLLDEERKCNDTNKITRIKNVITYQILDIQKEISNSFCKGSIKDKFVKAKISDEFIAKKKEELLNKEALRIKNKLLSDEYFEYYLTNSFEERSVKDYFNALLKFHPLILSGISLISMICYFVYFCFFVRYFPALNSSEILYVGVLMFSTTTLFVAFVILPIVLYSLHYKRYLEKNKKLYFSWLTFILNIPISIILLLILFIICYQCLKKCELMVMWIKKIDINIITCICFGVYTLLFFGSYRIVGWITHPERSNKQLFTCFVAFFLSTIFSVLIAYFIGNNFIGYMLVFLFCLFFYLMLVIGLLFLAKDVNKEENKVLVKILIVAVSLFAIIYCPQYAAIIFEISNVDYKYLSIEKSVASALPEKICKNGKNKNCDFNKTYYDENETSGVIKLYNIKALSTLGKFYYLETIGYKNKDDKETKFELDSSKIISREKQER